MRMQKPPLIDGDPEKFQSASLDKQGQENLLRLAKAYEKGGEKAMRKGVREDLPEPEPPEFLRSILPERAIDLFTPRRRRRRAARPRAVPRNSPGVMP